MRRGLMGWNAEELPKAALEARIARLRAAMQRDGFDAALFYTNLVQPSAVTWLTGFTPYWSDGMLLLPRDGAPVFATALSKRVANWIRTTDTLSEIVNTPKPGAARRQAASRMPAASASACWNTTRCRPGSTTRSSAPRPLSSLPTWADVFADVAAQHRRCRARPDRTRRYARANGARSDRRGQGRRRRRSRGAGREARAARRRRGSLYRGGCRSRRRPPPDPRRGNAAARGPLRGARVGRLQGRLGAADPELRPRRGRARAYAAPTRGLRALSSSIEPGKPLDAQLAEQAEGAAQRQPARLDGGKLRSAAIRLKRSPMLRPRGASWC